MLGEFLTDEYISEDKRNAVLRKGAYYPMDGPPKQQRGKRKRILFRNIISKGILENLTFTRPIEVNRGKGRQQAIYLISFCECIAKGKSEIY